jgi:hypothetical protein
MLFLAGNASGAEMGRNRGFDLPQYSDQIPVL